MDELEYIELQDGNETIRLKILDSFGVEEKDYAALLDENEEQLYILEVQVEDEEVIFKTIDDEKEFEEILEIYNDLLDE